MGKSSIEWTTDTWNPTRGCSVISPGCGNCYAMRQAHRFSGPGMPYEGLTKLTGSGPQWTGKVHMAPEMLGAPLRWRAPRRVFVNSMSDLFHESLSPVDIAAVFGVMAACPQHTFQVLTKRAVRMRDWFRWYEGESGAGCSPYAAAVEATNRGVDIDALGLSDDPWPLPNVWLGVSAEDQQRADGRISHLLATPAALRFVSAEPLLGPVDLSAYLANKAWRCRRCGERWDLGEEAWLGLHPAVSGSGPLCPNDACGGELDAALGEHVRWVIVGGESGPKARITDAAHIRQIVDQCRVAGVPVFVKQLGRTCIDTDWHGFAPLPIGGGQWDQKGGDMAEWPADLRVREFPAGTTATEDSTE